MIDQLARHGQHIDAFRTAAEDHREDFPVAQGVGAVPFQPFLRSLAGDHVFDSTIYHILSAHPFT